MSLTAQYRPKSHVESVGLEQWTTARDAVKKLHASNATYSACLAALVEFVPKVFHRQHEMKKTDTRHMRAVLDYIIYLQDPTNTTGAIQRRQSKEPYYRNDVIGALRDAIPARIFLQPEIGWLKDDLQKQRRRSRAFSCAVIDPRAYCR